MFRIKKHRHKPLYKQFIRLRKNVQNRPILRVTRSRPFPNNANYIDKIQKIKFKKQKWKGLIFELKKVLQKKHRKKHFKLYNPRLYYIFQKRGFPNYFSRKFSNKINAKKSLSLFYGGLLEKYIKRQVNFSLKKTKYSRNNFGNINLFFLKMLESRLDTVLYRSFFALSIRNARQIITHGHVLVNKNIVKTNSFILKKGDLVEINPNFHERINKNIHRSFIYPIPPKYLVINFRTFQIFFHENIENTNLSLHFPFWVDTNTVVKYYR